MIDQQGQETPSAQSAQLTIEEVVNVAVQSLNIREQKRFSVSDIKALIPEFNGDGDIVQWFARIHMVKDSYNVDDNVVMLVLTSKLEGRAKTWFYSRAEYVGYNLRQLEDAMTQMFKCKEDRITLMRKFERRRWQKNEKFADYYYDKILMGNKLGISENDLIGYVIDGFDDRNLQTQAKMKEFTTLAKMLEIMNDITPAERQHGPSVKRTSGLSPAISSTRSIPSGSQAKKCFNCNEAGHLANVCPKPKRERGSCFRCGKTDHQVKNCPSREGNRVDPDSTTMFVEKQRVVPAYTANVALSKSSSTVVGVVDSGSPISLICKELISDCDISPYDGCDSYVGFNQSPINILGLFQDKVTINDDIVIDTLFYVIPSDCISFKVLLGRNFIANESIVITFSDGKVHIEKVQSETNEINFDEILLINDIHFDKEPNLDVEKCLSFSEARLVRDIFDKDYVNAHRPNEPKIPFEMKVKLKSESPFYFKPKRLSIAEQSEVRNICDDLLERNIIKPSNSEYSSSIVLVKKKNGQTRMCIDFRQLNKITLRENFPIPNIEEQIDKLKNKSYFTRLDLKNAFFHIKVHDNCTKYFSFVTPFGQFEYLRMPFGFCNSPSIFMRYINLVFNDLLRSGEIFIYMDDLLIATSDIETHCNILSKVFKLLVENLLELRLDKCSFLKRQIEYLGYIIDEKGVSPSPNNIKAVTDFPIPRNFKDLQSFIGLISYFRKFICNFSIIAKPLYDLLKRKTDFCFGSKELEVFENFKKILSDKPLLSIYSPTAETQLHCDASSLGFGAILLQKQNDGQFHPVFFFSKRTTDVETRYHSYELEMLCIVYSLKRFHVYLFGIKFKIFTDCDSIRLTMNKKDLVPRISRWVLFLSDYNYEIEHRPNSRMKHVDALSRCHNVLVLEENSFEQVLSIKQLDDPEIAQLRAKLEIGQLPLFELRHGLVYRKHKNKERLLFYVPKSMITNVIRVNHDNVGHIGLEKTCELILRTYWFPDLRVRVRNYIDNCLKCITFSSSSGKVESQLHSIPKGNVPFDTYHIDHYGPLEKCRNGDRYIFIVIDAFTKFIKLYSCRTTNSKEAIKHLKSHFVAYSKPNRVICDRGSAFISQSFKDFLEQEDVKLIHIATGSPWANGQVERFNRTIRPMIAKLTETPEKWNNVISKVEFALNNTIVKVTGEAPSKLLFGIYQTSTDNEDSVKVILDSLEISGRDDIKNIREKASEKIVKSQEYNAQRYNQVHKVPHKYKVGDKVVVTNHVATPGVNKKLLPKFKGPYEIEAVLPHDRYALKDVEGHQITQIPYHGTVDASHMKLWLHDDYQSSD